MCAISLFIISSARPGCSKPHPTWPWTLPGRGHPQLSCLTTLIVKNFFVVSNLNLPSLSLKSLFLVLSQQALLKTSLSSFSIGPIQVLEGCYKVSPQSSLLHAEEPQFSQLFLIGEVLQPSDQLCGPPLDPLQQLHVLLVLRAPELDVGLQVGSHQSRAERQNPLPRPAGHVAFDSAQDMVGCLGSECIISGSCWAFYQPTPPSCSPQALSTAIMMITSRCYVFHWK